MAQVVAACTFVVLASTLGVAIGVTQLPHPGVTVRWVLTAGVAAALALTAVTLAAVTS